jgi:site-specific DNA-methyltransferase (adenine-specific)
MKKYQIIYADPPWNSNSQFGRDKKKGNEQHYPLMTLEDICNLEVGMLADENCILFLWVVDTQLFDVEKVIKSWGFKYKTVGFTWAKETSTGKDHFGVGMWTRKNPEMCLIATKGHPKRISAGVRQLQRYKVREHSRKPDEFRDEIVKLCGDLPRLEMFSRQKTEGWDVWGNEVVSDINLTASSNELKKLRSK